MPFKLDRKTGLRALPFVLCAAWLLAGFYCAAINLDASTRHSGLLLAAGWLMLVLAIVRRGALPTAGALGITAAAVYFIWGWSAQVTPLSDFARFLAQAQEVAGTGSLAAWLGSRSPVLVLWHALFQWLFGSSLAAAYVAAALLWAVQAPLLIGTLLNFGLDRRLAALTGVLYLLGPGVIAFAPVVSAESMAHTLLMLALFLISGIRRWEPGRLALLAGVLALLFLTRMNGVVFVLAFGLYATLALPASAAARRPQFAIPLFTAIFFACLLTFGGARALSGGEFGISASSWRAGLLLCGTNREYNGTYNNADWELAGYTGPNRVSQAVADRRAWDMAWERIDADPFGFLGFALTNKLNQVWGEDAQALHWSTIRSPLRKDWNERGLATVLKNLINSYWVFLLGSAALGTVVFIRRSGRLEHEVWLRAAMLIALPCLLLALSQIFLDVQARYHMIFMPFIALAAAYGICELMGMRLALPAVKMGLVRRTGGDSVPAAPNRRRQRRVPIVVSAEVVTDAGLKLIGQTRDLSIRGVYIMQIQPLPMDSECSITILLETAGRPIRLALKGKVVRSEADSMALEFTAMTRECYENLQFVVAHNAAAQRRA